MTETETKKQPATTPNGDTAADFATLYTRWKEPLKRLLRNRFGKSPEEAEDATHDILLRAHAQGTAHWQEHDADAARYLHAAARNHVTDEWRRKGRGAGPRMVSITEVESEAQALPGDPSADPEEIAANRQLIARVSDAVDELPPRQRQAFLLNRIDGLSYEQVAEIMGLSPRMVAKHISRALAYCEVRAQYASLEQMRAATGNGQHQGPAPAEDLLERQNEQRQAP